MCQRDCAEAWAQGSGSTWQRVRRCKGSWPQCMSLLCVLACMCMCLGIYTCVFMCVCTCTCMRCVIEAVSVCALHACNICTVHAHMYVCVSICHVCMRTWKPMHCWVEEGATRPVLRYPGQV